MDEDIQGEWARQRDHLEKTVGSLKVQLAKDTELQQQKNLKLLRVSCLSPNPHPPRLCLPELLSPPSYFSVTFFCD